AVELGSGDDMVAGADERGEGDELGRHPRGGGHCADPALEGGEALLERGDGGVADAGVDVPVLLQGEEARGVCGVGEDEARRLVDRHCAGARGRVRHPSCVQRPGAEAPGAVGHVSSCCSVCCWILCWIWSITPASCSDVVSPRAWPAWRS